MSVAVARCANDTNVRYWTQTEAKLKTPSKGVKASESLCGFPFPDCLVLDFRLLPPWFDDPATLRYSQVQQGESKEKETSSEEDVVKTARAALVL